LFKTAVSSALALAIFTGAGAALAERPLPADPMNPKKVRIDGMLREWPRSAIKLTKTEKGKPAARVEAFVGYDSSSLYLAFDVRDAHFARQSFGTNEDHAELVLEIPTSGKHAQKYDIGIYAGQPGKSAGQAKVNGRKVQAQVVEAPNDRGYTVEAKIPWSAFPAASRVRVGMKAQFKYVDASAPGRVLGVATSRRAPLFIGAEQSLYQNLLEPKGLDAEADFEAIGDVAENSMKERVAIYGGLLVIVGSHYKKGKQFYYKDLLMPDASLVTRFDVRDTDGDGKDEIILQRKTGGTNYREIFEILKVAGNGAAERVFAHEVAIVTPDGTIKNDVKLTPSGGKVTITISQGKAEGFHPDTFREPPHEGMATALLPWETVGSRVIRWDGTEYAVDKETKQKPRIVSKKKSAPVEKGTPGGADTPPPPRPPTSAELLDQVYALYRKDRGKQKSEPRFDFVTDVAGSVEVERVLVHENEVLVFGKEFLGGTSYTYIGIGVGSPDDVLDVTARDLTGDGKAEIIVRGMLHAKGGEELDDVEVTRYAMFVYQVTEGGISRIFGLELGRQIGENRVIGGMALRPAATGWDIVALPGRAVGWDERTYPFSQDEGPAGGLEPLILPWTRGQHRYSFSGTTYTPE
jgi:hypothetical protein